MSRDTVKFLKPTHWHRTGKIFAVVVITLLAVVVLMVGIRIQRDAGDLAYVDIHGDVWLTSGVGDHRRKLLSNSRCPNVYSLTWSPAGNPLVCRGRTDLDSLSDVHDVLVMFDITGRVILELKAVTHLAWSPDGRHVAYSIGIGGFPLPGALARFYVADPKGKTVEQFAGLDWGFAWAPDGSGLAYTAGSGEITILELTSKQRRSLGPGTILEWMGDLMIIATDRRVADIGEYDLYKAYVLDQRTQRRTRLSLLDDTASFWTSPNYQDPVVVAYTPGGGDQLSIVHLDPLRIRRVKDSKISSSGSFYIGGAAVALSGDGSTVYWADVGSESSTVIYRSGTDGIGITTVGIIPPADVRFSPDLTRVAYTTRDEIRMLWIARINGSEPRQINRFYSEGGFGDFSWRPRGRR